MDILILQHSAGDSPAEAERALRAMGHRLEIIRADQDEPIPESVHADGVIAFGSPFSLASGTPKPWVAQEMNLLRRYVENDKHVLGICLGGQLLAKSMGAAVVKNRVPEVGWHVVSRVHESADTAPPDVNLIVDSMPTEFTVLQWHQDTFEIPQGATHIFRSEACENQAFALSNRAFGFQFHLEADERLVRLFMAVSDLPSQQGDFIQNEKSIRDGIEKHLAAQNGVLQSFLSTWLNCQP